MPDDIKHEIIISVCRNMIYLDEMTCGIIVSNIYHLGICMKTYYSHNMRSNQIWYFTPEDDLIYGNPNRSRDPCLKISSSKTVQLHMRCCCSVATFTRRSKLVGGSKANSWWNVDWLKGRALHLYDGFHWFTLKLLSEISFKILF